MTIESAIEAQIKDLQYKANNAKTLIGQWVAKRDGAQSVIDREQTRLDETNILIDHLRQSLSDIRPPEWKVGDRFRWADSMGTITSISPHHVDIRTDAGASMGMSFGSFKDAARRVS